MSATKPPAVGLPEESVTPLDADRAPVDRRRGLRRIPRIALDATRLVHRAAPRQLRIAVILQVVTALLVGAQLYVIRGLVSGLVDVARQEGDGIARVAPSFALLLAATVAIGAVAALLDQQQRLLTEHVARATLDDIIGVASTVELAKFEEAGFYDQMERAMNAGMVRPISMVQSLMGLLLGVLTSIGIMIALLTLEPLLVPLVLLAGAPILLATLSNSRQSYAFEYAMTTHARERLHLAELFTDRDTAKELRVFAAAPFLRQRYDALSDERISRMEVFLRARLKVSLTGTAAGTAGTALALASLVWLLSTGRMGVASAATAAIAMQVLAGRISTVTGSIGTLVESGMFLDDLRVFLELSKGIARDASVAEGHVAAEPEPFASLEVEHVSFTYPGTGRQVLDDVSLHVGQGEVIAIVGENGSGKTTLVKLLCQLYGVQRGAVRWNGQEVAEVDPERLRAGITVLFQDFVRYHLSVSDNIFLGRSDEPRDEERIRAAAMQAGAIEMVGDLPAGFDTRLGRQFLGGYELSGGQWQRLALARAFYRGGGFLIMDEPTAALDPRAEFRLFEQMRELAAGKSVLLISHRFANVKTADRIYVLDRGRVVESGRHDELMANRGLYAELFEMQAASYQDETGRPA